MSFLVACAEGDDSLGGVAVRNAAATLGRLTADADAGERK
jgi:hypothetical protein